MQYYSSGCLLCGEPLVHFDLEKNMDCAVCGKVQKTNAACSADHYICDACHTKGCFDAITAIAMTTAETNPHVIAIEMMRHGTVKMHGPEHHYLVAAALIAACKNAGGDIDLVKCLAAARERAGKLPGGICGLWGSCGAGVASGIFVSVVTGAGPLSGREWSLANAMTARSLADIAQNGGPRCCKRNSWLAIQNGLWFAREYLDTAMAPQDTIVCEFYSKNKQCKGPECLFYQ